MSPRSDIFLSLCLAQAELSPLHYRHGSIIVRGGKVIGQGFNCYRPGFDGGALKSGVLPSASLDGPAIAELKRRLKSKPKPKNKPDYQQDDGTFTPFESTGCGPNANVHLSMHSEMMAIRSALSLSSGTLSSQTSAGSAKCFEKPCFKLPGDSKKRKARARGLKAYAAAVCAEAEASGTSKSYGGKFSIQKSGFEPGSSQSGLQGGRQQVQRQGGEAVRGLEHMEKCRETPTEEVWPPKKPPSLAPKPQQILITKKNSLNTKADVKERTKDFRLKGSDLYVARLGMCQITPPLDLKLKQHASKIAAPASSSSPRSEPASLYDELSQLSRTPSPSTSPPNPPPILKPEVRASRPCYRCVSAMHAVGIKRVFWTNADGEWEGAKVRDLVDALEKGIEGDGDGTGTGQENKGVFVTKHEVLMLKRIMGF
ncbi:hypothetical protein L207DRAFT_627454 [Hyaloscypha variabilis F]|uniref:CMP/dCMP-type deaminase domain-containing protein n=1 Tax=Hyaloscypha variabilis (strain UAMH 11265 / GT02V1 / F) TaxID=1149755 RepID=A0A2J6SDB5_HYAVF|nr:hypothetical protein L207DRAFT_627454 [Hyaloscypha variabilis F]